MEVVSRISIYLIWDIIRTTPIERAINLGDSTQGLRRWQQCESAWSPSLWWRCVATRKPLFWPYSCPALSKWPGTEVEFLPQGNYIYLGQKGNFCPELWSVRPLPTEDFLVLSLPWILLPTGLEAEALTVWKHRQPWWELSLPALWCDWSLWCVWHVDVTLMEAVLTESLKTFSFNLEQQNGHQLS